VLQEAAETRGKGGSDERLQIAVIALDEIAPSTIGMTDAWSNALLQ
jgi:hypothetical protein